MTALDLPIVTSPFEGGDYAKPIANGHRGDVGDHLYQ